MGFEADANGWPKVESWVFVAPELRNRRGCRAQIKERTARDRWSAKFNTLRGENQLIVMGGGHESRV